MKGRRFGYLLREIECKSRDYNKKNKQEAAPYPLNVKVTFLLTKKKKKIAKKIADMSKREKTGGLKTYLALGPLSRYKEHHCTTNPLLR